MPRSNLGFVLINLKMCLYIAMIIALYNFNLFFSNFNQEWSSDSGCGSCRKWPMDEVSRCLLSSWVSWLTLTKSLSQGRGGQLEQPGKHLMICPGRSGCRTQFNFFYPTQCPWRWEPKPWEVPPSAATLASSALRPELLLRTSLPAAPSQLYLW